MDLNTTPLLAATVDRLAQVKAQIAELQNQEAAIKAELVATGLPVIDGMYHRVAISEVAPKASIDWKAIAQHFNPSRQLVTAHTSYNEAYTTVRCYARKTS